MKTVVQNILLGFDGTLIDSEVVHRKIWIDLFNHYGKPCHLFKENYLGLPAHVIAKKLFGKTLGNQAHKLFEEQEINRTYQWMPGAEEFIRQLRNEGKTLGIVTNSRLQKVSRFLDTKNANELFDVIVTCDDVTNRKPSPEPYLLALKHLNVHPNHVIAVEDSVTGLNAVRKAGLRYMLVQPQSGYTAKTWNNMLQDTLSLSSIDFPLAHELASKLWDFHKINDTPLACDVIVGLGSYDEAVAIKCANLLRQGFANHIIFTGKEGNWTAGKSKKTEARQFQEIALLQGVPSEQILLEEEATNIGQNIIFSQKIMQQRGWSKAIFVTKPQTTLRTRLTLQAQAPQMSSASKVLSPDYASIDSFLVKFGITQLFNEMVGDVERIILYPQKGFQAGIDIPKHVLEAYETLKDLGFTNHLMK